MTGGQRLILAFTLVAGFLGPAPVSRAEPPPELRLAALVPPPPPRDTGVRCTADGTACIRLASYVADVCRVIETAAQRNGLDPSFFARLIWKESLFDAAAISPAGAQGIAQFMPGTAKLRGLADPFNPAEALAASALYLADLSRDFGNIGLAAVAYNGGEARAQRFVADKAVLPAETRAYVQGITGHSADAWRDAPPEKVELALAGDGAGGASFQTACIAQAEARSVREFRSGPPVRAWGVIVASNRDRDGAERQVGRLQNRYAE
ncbi:MAG TPA: lytic transglycosylase domain-containing protein, partial [Amaricoccus sp.]|nr:lytic transglycosylase domain-containing protein [Amaricoccus sp.]